VNVLSGGDGSSGVPSPTKADSWTMSADEVRRYGSSMLLETKACAVELWTFTPPGDQYFRSADITSAMKDVAATAATRPNYSCAQGNVPLGQAAGPASPEPPQAHTLAEESSFVRAARLLRLTKW
jgi:hypothetical protein